MPSMAVECPLVSFVDWQKCICLLALCIHILLINWHSHDSTLAFDLVDYRISQVSELKHFEAVALVIGGAAGGHEVFRHRHVVHCAIPVNV